MKDVVGRIVAAHISDGLHRLECAWVYTDRYYAIKPLIESYGYGCVRPLMYGEAHSCGMIKSNTLQLQCWVLEPLPVQEKAT